MKGHILSILSVLLLQVMMLPCALAESDPRRVTIQWQKVPTAAAYDFQLSKSSEMESLIEHREVKKTKRLLTLPPGTYYFRLRGIDSLKQRGPWSEVKRFVVNPPGPKPLAPADGQVYRKPLPVNGLLVSWGEGSKGTDYRLQIRNAKKLEIDRHIKGTEYYWKPPAAGVFNWRVGSKTGNGYEWSKKRTFEIVSSAIDMTAVAIVERDPESWRRLSDKAGIWLIARYAQALAARTGNDRDSGYVPSGVSIVGMLSAELRFRFGREAGDPWVLSGSGNFEAIRQTVLDQDHMGPRLYARMFYTRALGFWRMGPFVHIGYGQGLFFLVQSPTQAIAVKPARIALGLGGSAVYSVAESLYISGILMLRLDTGGSDPSLPSDLGSDIGVEAGFGVFLGLSESWSLEGRLRVQQEAFNWAPTIGGEASTMGNTYLILDLGVGFKL